MRGGTGANEGALYSGNATPVLLLGFLPLGSASLRAKSSKNYRSKRATKQILERLKEADKLTKTFAIRTLAAIIPQLKFYCEPIFPLVFYPDGIFVAESISKFLAEYI